MRIPVIAAALAALSFAPLSAQQVFAFNDEDRTSSTVLAFGDELMAAVSISYSAPMWKAEYDAKFDTAVKGKRNRLGKNWWTTLQTATAIEIAGKKIESGSYVLGIECDKEGNFHLLVMDAGWAMKNKVMPWEANRWEKAMAIPLEFARGSLEETVEKMEIEITSTKGDAQMGKFAIRWGTHELSAKVNYMPGMKQVDEASAEKQDAEEEQK